MCEALSARFGDRVTYDEPVAKHTSARIGGPACVLLTAHSTEDLMSAAQIAWAYDQPLTVLGGGSNILVSDNGVDGIVINNKANNVRFTGKLCLAESGISTIKLARACAQRGLSGFEWAIGVPGTLGGAIYGNAGAHGADMSDSATFVYATTPEEPEVTWSKDTMAFGYRTSMLKQTKLNAVILSCILEFTPDSPDAIKERMEEYNTYRKRTQPPGATIGSMFKNPKDDYAGRLIDASGLKGKQIGGAQISTKHANFFLNVDNATATNVYNLAEHVQEVVMRDHSVALELEVELIGRW